MIPDARVPGGDLGDKWDNCLDSLHLLSPANKRKRHVIVVGTGLAGASAAATMAELGYRVEAFTFHDSPRRAHSIAAQGGINASKNYPNDGDSHYRLFIDTIKGGDFRAREANVYRLAQISGNIIDQCVAQGVPFAREYSGYLDNRSFGGALVSRTFYAKGQTGQQLLLGAYGAMNRQIHRGQVRLHTRNEMLELVLKDGRARGIITRDLISGRIRRHMADAVVLATGGYSNIFHRSTNAFGCNVTAIYRAYKRGALFANPCFTQIHPTCIPVLHEHQSKLTLMSESLRNHGRVWVPKQADDLREPCNIPEAERDYFLERKYPAYGNLSPRDIASRAVKDVCDAGRGVGTMKHSVYLDFKDAIEEHGMDFIEQRYGNLFDMYRNICNEDPYRKPMKIYPAAHYTMGGLWVDYHLMSNIPGLFVIGEANFSDHGANRLGASALMQGLADGYFILPQTIGNYFAVSDAQPLTLDDAVFAAAEQDATLRINSLLAVEGTQTVASLHRQLGDIMWQHCGMSRREQDLRSAIDRIQGLRDAFWQSVNVTGRSRDLNQALEYAGRVADFMEFAELMCRDALAREESCGAHFREEYQNKGEAARDDERFSHVAAWAYRGEALPERFEEKLAFEYVRLMERDYR
ncbi:MAG: fumarate reductase/succinate dehydrogenase flavoprotein subunit [Gammaproteobacteria bacterium]|jgi:succinate dehydrogenase / fumarate reductase flavoprotein subunit